MYMVFRGVFLIFCVLDKSVGLVLGDLTEKGRGTDSHAGDVGHWLGMTEGADRHGHRAPSE